MDVETLRLEREEKRRLRRERIRRILEDDGSPSRLSRLEKGEKGKESPPSQKSAVANRRARDHTDSSSPLKTHSNREERENADGKKTTERITRSTRNLEDSKTSPRTAQNDDSSASSLKAKRDARRKRSREHDMAQNKMTEKNGKRQSDVKSDKLSETKEERAVTRKQRLTERSSKTARDVHTSETNVKRYIDDGNLDKNDSEKTQDKKKEKEEGDEVKNLDDEKNVEETKEVDEIEEDAEVKGEAEGKRKEGESVENEDDVLRTTTSMENLQSDSLQDVVAVQTSEETLETDVASVVIRESNRGEKELSKEERQCNVDEPGGVLKSQLTDDVNHHSSSDKAMQDLSRDSVMQDLSRDNVMGDSSRDSVKQDSPTDIVEQDSSRDNVIKDSSTDNVNQDSSGDNVMKDSSTDNVNQDSSRDNVMADSSTDNVHVNQDLFRDNIMADSSTDNVNQDSSRDNIMADSSRDNVNQDSYRDNVMADSSTNNVNQDSPRDNVMADSSTDNINQDLSKDNVMADSSTDNGNQDLSRDNVMADSSRDNVNQDSSRDNVSHDSSRDNVNQDSSVDGVQDVTRNKSSANISNEVADSVSLESRIKSDLSSEKSSPRLRPTSPKKTVGETTAEKSATKHDRSARVGERKGSDESWQKNARKKKTVADRDRQVELMVLGRTGKIRDKLKTCETREGSDTWENGAKKGARKKKSLDEDTEKELQELSRRRDLKSRVKECEEQDNESAEAWKREVKKDVRKHKSIDEDTESELKELSKGSALKSRVKDCEEKDKESSEALKREVKKDVKKHKSLDEDTQSKLKELSKGSASKSRVKDCEEKDKESAEALKREVKKDVKKHKSLDEDTQSELKELSKGSALKSRIKEREEKDKESSEAWKREVKKDVKKHKSLDEDTENELKELSKGSALKSRVKSEEKDKESAEALKREVKKDVKKHKSLDEDTQSELKELSKGSALKSRIKEREEKDKESAEAWKREVKKDVKKHKSLDEDTENDLKELSKGSALKSRIKEREEKDKESAEASRSEVKNDAKKHKSLDEDTESELKELSNLSDLKSEIINSCEERDKESAEASMNRIRSSEREKSFDETQEEELKQLSIAVDVKTRIQSRIEENEKPKEIPKRPDPTDEGELGEINLNSRLDYKQESEKLEPDKKKLEDTGNAVGIPPTMGDTQDITSSTDEDSLPRDTAEKSNEQCGGEVLGETKSGINQTHETKIMDTKGPNKDDTRRGRTSPIKQGNKDDGHGGRTSPAMRDNKDDGHGGRTSPAKRDNKDEGPVGRTSPAMRNNKDDGHGGRTSPAKRDTSGRDSPTKDDGHHGTKDRISSAKRDTRGRVSPTKDNLSTKSKLENIRSNLYDGSKTKTKNKRESLDGLSKTVSIKDKISACKERDKMSPRPVPVEKTPSKVKPTAVPDNDTPNAGMGEVKLQAAGNAAGEASLKIPVNHMGDQFVSIEEETKDASIKDALSFWQQPGAERKPGETEVADDREEEVVDVDLKGRMSYWESPKRSDEDTGSDEAPAKDHERPATVALGSELKQEWQKRSRKLNTGEFIEELLNAKCKRRELKDIRDVESDTKKYLVIKKDEGGVGESSVKKDGDFKKPELVEKSVEEENKKNNKMDPGEGTEKISDDFSFDDVVNPNEVKQLRGFSDFRRQVRPANRRAAKSNPVRKLQQREDLRTGSDLFSEDYDEEDSPPKRTAVGRLGRPIEPGDRKSREIKTFAKDALAGLSAKEDVSKITLKKTAKSKKGVSQEKSEYDGTAPVMLMQIKGHRHMQTRLVEPSTESLNSGDAFVLVTAKYIFVWLGKDANVMKKSKASQLSNKILQYKLLNCNACVITIIKDGDVNIETALTRSFWNLLGGKKPVKSGKQVPNDHDYENGVVSSNTIFAVDTSSEPAKLERHSELCAKIPSIKMLNSDKSFIFDFGTEVYLWLGRTCDKATRTQAVDLAQGVFKGKFKTKNSLNPISPNASSDGKSLELKRPSWAVFGRMTERAETILFEQKFSDWPDAATKAKLDKQKDLLNKNLSSGYAKRKVKMEEVEVQLVELVPYDGAKMSKEPPPVTMMLEGVDVGRGRGSYDEIERRSQIVNTNSVTVYHSSEKEYRQLEEKEWGHFYSAESYVIRWSYSVKASGIRSLKGGDSKHETIGRDQIAYFFWHGRDCSVSGKGTSALATIELDSDKSPQIMVDEGNESACFLNMFDGQMIVHHGKSNETQSIVEDNVLMYCVQHEDEREINLVQIEARSSNLRSRSSFIVVVIGTSIGICVWHGAKASKEKKEGALRGAKRLAVWFKDLFDVDKLDIVELEEGNEGALFWEALDGKHDYGSLVQSERNCDYRVRLFNFTSTEGPFVAREILNPTRGDLVSPYPFRQSHLYSSSQPTLFLLDAVHEMYLWQGWWPVDPEESDASATTTGSAEFMWHRDRKLAMQTIQSYADIVGRQMSKSYVVNAGLEPVEFRAFFPFWEQYPDVERLNLESGKLDGGKSSLPELLTKLSRDRYTLAELLVRPLPEGVDPSKMEVYLSDDEFKEVFNMKKDEFSKLPKWKKLEQRKKAGLF